MRFANTVLPPLGINAGEFLLTNDHNLLRSYGLCGPTDCDLKGIPDSLRGALVINHDNATGEVWMADGSGVEAWIPGFNDADVTRGIPSAGIWRLNVDGEPLTTQEAVKLASTLMELRRAGFNGGMELIGAC